ncbi:hypothetical protein INR49_011298 [Caranx melampygus]|nr:hypothetical protein INR49_011298 [Caranx melampygus]
MAMHEHHHRPRIAGLKTGTDNQSLTFPVTTKVTISFDLWRLREAFGLRGLKCRYISRGDVVKIIGKGRCLYRMEFLKWTSSLSLSKIPTCKLESTVVQTCGHEHDSIRDRKPSPGEEGLSECSDFCMLLFSLEERSHEFTHRIRSGFNPGDGDRQREKLGSGVGAVER